MSSPIDNIFGKENLLPALLVGIILIVACLLPEFILLVLVVVAVIVLLIGLLNFLDDRDVLALIVAIVGLLALILLVLSYNGTLHF